MAQSVSAVSHSLREDVLSLLQSEVSPWASMYMPMDGARNRIQLRTLLGQLRDEASLMGVEQANIDALLGPAKSLLEEASLSTDEIEGVALFLTPDVEEHTLFELPFAPSLHARLDKRPHVRPLWRGIEPNGRFFILSLWGGGARLHRASRHQIDVIPPKGEPHSLDAVLRSDEHVQRSLKTPKKSPSSTEPPDRRPTLYRSQKELRQRGPVKEGVLRFLREVDDRLRPLFGNESTPPPLVLAGPRELRRLYREVNNYGQLLKDGIEDAVRMEGSQALHRQAWERVRPHFDRDREDALERYKSASKDETASSPGSVLLRALEGRVDTLFVAEEPEVWGVFDEAAHRAHPHSRRQVGDTEFLNTATVGTLVAGGTAYVTATSDLPNGSSVAALLRY